MNLIQRIIISHICLQSTQVASILARVLWIEASAPYFQISYLTSITKNITALYVWIGQERRSCTSFHPSSMNRKQGSGLCHVYNQYTGYHTAVEFLLRLLSPNFSSFWWHWPHSFLFPCYLLIPIRPYFLRLMMMWPSIASVILNYLQPWKLKPIQTSISVVRPLSSSYRVPNIWSLVLYSFTVISLLPRLITRLVWNRIEGFHTTCIRI